MIYKKGRYYMVKFQWQGQTIRRSTRASDAKTARSIEGKIRSELALGNFNIVKAKRPPSLRQFLTNDFVPFIEGHFLKGSKTRDYYLFGVGKLLKADIAKLHLDEITSQHSSQLAARFRRWSPGTINCVLRTLRRALKLAEEWKVLGRAPKVILAKGEIQRERVLTDEEVKVYLTACAQPWRDVATIMYCLGNRPSELYCLRWEDVILERDSGFMKIKRGKSKKARRTLPLVPAVHRILEARHNDQGQPSEGWVFPSQSKSGHLEQGSAKNQHVRAIERSGVKAFPPYVFRHTALTNLAPNVDPFTLQTIAGHSSITMTQRYCHPQAEAIVQGLKKLAPRQEVVTDGGHLAKSEQTQGRVGSVVKLSGGKS